MIPAAAGDEGRRHPIDPVISTGGRLKLDPSSWPVVHGSRESLDLTKLTTPSDGAHLSFWNSQDGTFGQKKHAMPTFKEASCLTVGQPLYMTSAGGPFPPNFNMADANPVSVISEKVSETEQRLWTSGFKNVQVFRQVEGSTKLEPLARYDHGQFDFRFHGSYAFTASNATATSFLVAMKDKLFRYSYVKDDEEASGYRIAAEEALLRDPQLGEEEEVGDDDESNYLVALTLSTEGTVLVASKSGNVTAIQEDATSGGKLVPVSSLRLLDHVQTDTIHISNSISVHNQGIFIVTQEEMVRVDIDPDTQQLSFKWSTRYGPDRPWYTSRLGPGSGSTPTITSCLGRDVVVITDGELDMGLIYYDAETGEELARTKVDFGPSVKTTTSEQSVAVRGCQAFVVNNYIGVDGIDDDVYCSYFQGRAAQKGLSKFCSSLQPEFIAKVCPAVFGCVGYGAAMYVLEEKKEQTPRLEGTTELSPSSSTDTGFQLRRQWGRDDLSCGTSIPLISDPEEPSAPSITYCVGMKRNESLWSLIGLDTDTGADVLYFPFYKERLPSLENFFANPYFAGVEAVGNKALAIGSIGGVNYLTTTTTTIDSHVAPPPSSSSSLLRDAPPTPPQDPAPAGHVWWTPQTALLAVLAVAGLVGLLIAAAIVGYRYGRRRRGGAGQGAAGRSKRRQEGAMGGGQEDDDDDIPYHQLVVPTEDVWEARQQHQGGFIY